MPILQHGDFMLYETSAIVAYLEEVFPTPSLQPETAQGRALMNQWISAVNSYYYPYMIYHVGHERNVFPAARHPVRREGRRARTAEDRGRAAGDGAPAVARPGFPARQRGQGWPTITCCRAPIPSAATPEGKAMYADFPAVREWRERMEALPTVRRFRAAQPPRAPIEHARKWAVSHRPKY